MKIHASRVVLEKYSCKVKENINARETSKTIKGILASILNM